MSPQKSQRPRLTPVTRHVIAGDRATLEGLETEEASIQEWLAAGGERRKKARPPKAPPAQQKRA